jgi:hypothetical protein
MKKEINENKVINYGLKEIQTIKYNFNSPEKKITNQTIEFNFNILPTIKYLTEKDYILVTINVSVVIKETEEEILNTETVFVYHAIDLKDFLVLKKDENTWSFKDSKNEGLLVTLISVSLSTMRGIIFEKAQGTILANSPIPIMNPSQFVKSSTTKYK